MSTSRLLMPGEYISTASEWIYHHDDRQSSRGDPGPLDNRNTLVEVTERPTPSRGAVAVGAMGLVVVLIGIVALASRSGPSSSSVRDGVADSPGAIRKVLITAAVALVVSMGAIVVAHKLARRRAPLAAGLYGSGPRTVAHAARHRAPIIATVVALAALVAASTVGLRSNRSTSNRRTTSSSSSGNGNGGLGNDTNSGANNGAVGGSAQLDVTDINGDGRPDLVVRKGSGVVVMRPCPHGAVPKVNRSTTATIDTNCDGKADTKVTITIDPRLDQNGDRYLDQPIDYNGDGVVDPKFNPKSAVSTSSRSTSTNSKKSTLWATLARVVAWVLGSLLLVALIVVAYSVMRNGWPRRQQPDDAPGDDAPDDLVPDGEVMAGSIADSIDAMLADTDPRTAIIGAYAQLLRGLDTCGLPRRPEEAPFEHLNRCFVALRVDPTPMSVIAGLYSRARFSTHRLDESHRRHALAALQQAAADMADVAERQPQPV